jgi:hypothetical protein
MLVEQALCALAQRGAEFALGTIDQLTQQIDQVHDVVRVASAHGLTGAAVRRPIIGHIRCPSVHARVIIIISFPPSPLIVFEPDHIHEVFLSGSRGCGRRGPDDRSSACNGWIDCRDLG